MSESWLSCVVEDGMFSDERLVVFTTADDKEVSFFVPKSATEGDRLRVHVFERAGRYWVVIPTEDRALVPVSEAALVA